VICVSEHIELSGSFEDIAEGEDPPTPNPRNTRPTMSMATLTAAVFRMAPTMKLTPPTNIVHLRPSDLQR
jgi:hypothetical protein